MDDRLPRRKAQSKELKTIGTIGVLLLAHQQQFISTSQIEDYLTALTPNTQDVYFAKNIERSEKINPKQHSIALL
ncbi:hypothetical protein BGS_0192 [Beggiatoa sp. SS]|nr:hypothetical protein BGS_0192 [Beggiatoa sp. SS]